MGLENVSVDPMRVSLKGPQVSSVTTVADVASNLNNKYFRIEADAGAIKYAVWYNVGAAGVAPSVSGATMVPVAIAVGASAAAVASATASALTGITGNKFKASASGSVVTVSTVKDGQTAATVDGAAPTGFTFSTINLGLDYDLGLIEGDISLGFTQDTFAIKSHQTGSQTVGEINIGTNLEAISLNLQESHLQNLKTVLTGTGIAYTPSAGTEVIGVGTSERFANLSNKGYKLVLHPTRVLNANDRSRDLCFWKATPLLENITFSGEKATVLATSFKIAVDFTKVDQANLFVLGDWSQNFDKVS